MDGSESKGARTVAFLVTRVANGYVVQPVPSGGCRPIGLDPAETHVFATAEEMARHLAAVAAPPTVTWVGPSYPAGRMSSWDGSVRAEDVEKSLREAAAKATRQLAENLRAMGGRT
jgi:hypothetical protein